MGATSRPCPREPRWRIVGCFSLWLMLSVIVTAVVVLLAHQLQRHDFWPILLAPLLLGSFGGVGYALLAREAGVRHPWACAVTAALLATSADAALFRLAYHQYRWDLRAATGRSRGSAKGLSGLVDAVRGPADRPIPIGDLADRHLELEVGRGGFVGFVLWRAREGVRVGPWRVGRSGMVVLWCLEWLLWTVGSVAVVWGAASHPYFTVCSSWYDRP